MENSGRVWWLYTPSRGTRCLRSGDCGTSGFSIQEDKNWAQTNMGKDGRKHFQEKFSRVVRASLKFTIPLSLALSGLRFQVNLTILSRRIILKSIAIKNFLKDCDRSDCQNFPATRRGYCVAWGIYGQIRDSEASRRQGSCRNGQHLNKSQASAFFLMDFVFFKTGSHYIAWNPLGRPS